jgi:hypothetical protein
MLLITDTLLTCTHQHELSSDDWDSISMVTLETCSLSGSCYQMGQLRQDSRLLLDTSCGKGQARMILYLHTRVSIYEVT